MATTVLAFLLAQRVRSRCRISDPGPGGMGRAPASLSRGASEGISLGGSVKAVAQLGGPGNIGPVSGDPCNASSLTRLTVMLPRSEGGPEGSCFAI